MNDLKKLFAIFIVVALLTRPIMMKLFDKSVHRGSGYTVICPPGWAMRKEEDTVFFDSPTEKVLLEIPEATFSIMTKKMDRVYFIDDLFPDIMQQFIELDGRILDKGEIKVDDIISKWVLFLNTEPEMMIWTFFLIDDLNQLVKIQYVTFPDTFGKYRPDFETFKNSIRLKKLVAMGPK